MDLLALFLAKALLFLRPQQIAIAAYHTTAGDPNANMWADAYANFGYIGVSCIHAYTCRSSSGSTTEQRRIPRGGRQLFLITVPALTLANSALFTCLLTHGMLLALLVVTQWPRIIQQGREPRGRKRVTAVLDLSGCPCDEGAHPAAPERQASSACAGMASHSGQQAASRPAAACGNLRSPSAANPADCGRARPAVRPSGQGRVRKAGFTVLIGSGLGSAVSLLVTPLISRVFDPAVYGKFALITGVTSVFVGVSTFRLEVQSLRTADDAEATGLIRLGLITSCAWGAALTLVACLAVALWHSQWVLAVDRGPRLPGVSPAAWIRSADPGAQIP